MISIDVWQFLMAGLSVLVTLTGAAFGLGKILLSQFEQRLNARFEGQDTQQKAAQTHMDNRFSSLEQALAKGDEESLRIERELMALKAELPNNYVRRDDFIRVQSVIETKIDGLAMKIENAILRGEKHG